jgi:hypothetical protein
MPERLVDVEKQGANVLHTFPVTIASPAGEEAFKLSATSRGEPFLGSVAWNSWRCWAT